MWVSDVTFVTFFGDKKCDGSHLSHFWEECDECDALAHDFFLNGHVFCHILPKKRQIRERKFWPHRYKTFLNGKKCDDSAGTETCFFSSRLRFVTYLAADKIGDSPIK